MKKYFSLISVITGVLIPFLVCAQMNAGKLLTKNKSYKINYSESDSEIIMDVGLKGKTQKFMLDSGAPVFISDSIQAIYNFPILMKAELGDASDKKGEVIIVEIDTLIVGPFIFAKIPALVLNYKNSPLQCVEFVGNFGSNALRFLVVQFDLKNKEVTLTDNLKLLKDKPENWQSATIDGQSDFFFPVRINDGFTDTVHIDTGDKDLYNMARVKAEKLASIYPKEVLLKGYGVTSIGALGLPDNSVQIVMKPDEISICNISLKRGLIYTTERNVSRMGRYLLNYGMLTLNYKKEKLAFKKYDDPELPARSSFGVSFTLEGKKVFAGTVWDDSKASKSGMKSSDEIISLNGKIFSSMSECEVLSSLRKELKSEELKVEFTDSTGNSKNIILQRSIIN